VWVLRNTEKCVIIYFLLNSLQWKCYLMLTTEMWNTWSDKSENPNFKVLQITECFSTTWTYLVTSNNSQTIIVIIKKHQLTNSLVMGQHFLWNKSVSYTPENMVILAPCSIMSPTLQITRRKIKCNSGKRSAQYCLKDVDICTIPPNRIYGYLQHTNNARCP
jgi:hypothetical protein